MKDSLFKELIKLVRYLASLELTSTAGRINILGMILALLLAVSLSLAPIFETLIKLVHPNANIGPPILPIFVFFCCFTLTCSLMIGYLEGMPRHRVNRVSPGEQDAQSDGEGLE